MNIIGTAIIILGICFMILGVIGLFKYKGFYTRILLASKIDTMGALTVLIGVTLKSESIAIGLRVLLLLALMFIINPMVTHIIVRSAYEEGLRMDNVIEKDEEE